RRRWRRRVSFPGTDLKVCPQVCPLAHNPPMRRESTAISPVADIVADLRAGKTVVLVDDEDRQHEGDLVFAAEFVTPEKINFLARHGRGLICMPITEAHALRLGLKPT